MKILEDIEWSNIITVICLSIMTISIAAIPLVLLLAMWSNIASLLLWKTIGTAGIAMLVSWMIVENID